MSLRSSLPFLVAVFFVAIVGVFLALQIFGAQDPETRTQLVTVEVIITATPDPNVTPNVVVITATTDRTQVAIPDDIVPQDDAGPADGTAVVSPGDSTPLADSSGESALASSLPAGCIVHVVESGDTPFGVAEIYEIDGFLLMQANGLTEETAINLQIGDELIVPLEGCPVTDLENFIPDTPTPADDASTQVATGTPDDDAEADDAEATPEVSPTPSVTPTVTLAPTASDAQVEIVGILDAGDVTAEGVRIRNLGSTVTITGWTLSDLDGNEYVFGEQRIFSNSEVTVFTRTGQDTPIALFWGLDEPVWNANDVVTLRDSNGVVQATQRIDSPIELE